MINAAIAKCLFSMDDLYNILDVAEHVVKTLPAPVKAAFQVAKAAVE